jgi:hypothetical protein
MLIMLLFNGGTAKGLDIDAVLSAISNSIKEIKTYDLHISVKHVFPFRQRFSHPPINEKGGAASGSTLQRRSPGEPAETRIDSYRQIGDAIGRRRVESLGPDGKWFEAWAFDGEITRSLNTTLSKASLSPVPPAQGPFLPASDRYEILLGELFQGGSLLDLLVQRRQVLELTGTDQTPVIHVPTMEGRLYPRFSWLIELDPGHGMLPKKITTFEKGVETPLSVTEITAFQRLKDGHLVPTEGNRKEFAPPSVGVGDSPVVITYLTIDSTQSRWNEPLDETLFTIHIPPGTSVRDDVRKLVYVSGNANPAANLDDLAKGAKKVLSIKGQPIGSILEGDHPHSWRRWAIAANVVAVFLLLIAIYRMRKRAAASLEP